MWPFDRNKKVIAAFKELGDISAYRAITTYGIVNPFGPTMNILATLSNWRNKSSLPVYLLQLHPFSPEILKKWTLPMEEQAHVETINNILDEVCDMRGGCPTFLYPGSLWSEDDSYMMLVKIVMGKEGGVETAELCRRFRANAFARVTYEIASSGQKLQERKEGKWDNSKLSGDEAKEFVLFQTQDKSMRSEFEAFRMAYNGAIKHVPMLPVKLPYNDFLTMFQTIVEGLQ